METGVLREFWVESREQVASLAKSHDGLVGTLISKRWWEKVIRQASDDLDGLGSRFLCEGENDLA